MREIAKSNCTSLCQSRKTFLIDFVPIVSYDLHFNLLDLLYQSIVRGNLFVGPLLLRRSEDHRTYNDESVLNFCFVLFCFYFYFLSVL